MVTVATFHLFAPRKAASEPLATNHGNEGSSRTRLFRRRAGPAPKYRWCLPSLSSGPTVARGKLSQEILLDFSGRPLRGAQPQPPITLRSPWPFSWGFIFERGSEGAAKFLSASALLSSLPEVALLSDSFRLSLYPIQQTLM